MRVKVAMVGKGVKEVDVGSGATIKDCLEQADYSAAGFTITLNGSEATTSSRISDNDRVVLAAKNKGN